MKRQVCTWYTKPTTKTTLITLTLYILYTTTTNKKYEVINYTGPPHATILCHNSILPPKSKKKMDFFNKNKREVKVLFSFFATRKEEDAEIRKEEEDFPL